MPRRHRSARGLLRTVLALVGLAMAALLTAGANASPQLIGLEIGNLGGTTSGASAVNNSGQVVGAADTKKNTRHAFLWSRGKMRDLGTLGRSRGLDSIAYGINRSGQVVGRSDLKNFDFHAFVWSKGKMRDLETLAPKDEDSGAYGINDSGQVVGWSDVDEPSGDLGTHAVLWSAGTLTDLGTFVGTGDLSSEANDINNSGQVVGWSDISGGEHAHAFLWSSGTMTDLGTSPLIDSSAVAINDSGQVVGSSWSITSSGGRTRRVDHAFLWSDGTMRNLGTLGGKSSDAADINDSGEVVGASQTRSGRWHAFLWTRGKMIDLGTLGAHDSGAAGVNASGDVVGAIGLDAKGYHRHAVLWTGAKKAGKTTVPSLRGMTLTDAHDAIARAEGTLGRLHRAFSSQVKAGGVISQSPRAGTKVRWGTKIDLVISRGATR